MIETETRTPSTAPRERTTADVLRAAARYIEEHGWYPGDPSGGAITCLFTGIGSVEPPGDRRLAAYDAVYAVIGGRTYSDIFDWNDTPGRTRDEVLAALRAAADASEVRG
jgi:hypothetical protein